MLDFSVNTIDPLKAELVRHFLNGNVEKYILGRNETAKLLSEKISISGYIDEFTAETEWLGKPIFKGENIKNKNAIIVSCSLAIYPNSSILLLKELSFINILSVLDLHVYSDFELNIKFMSSAQKDLDVNFDKYKKIYGLLSEKESKNIFHNILSFRKKSDLSYMKDYSVDPIGQYFEDFLNLQTGEVFIDAGAFDGKTSLEFIKHCPKFKSIYIFEPDIENLNVAKDNLSTHENTIFFAKGLSSHKETLRFNNGSGSASSISECGTSIIEVDSLDNLVSERVTFIKMDIEGAEGDALAGMKNHILNDHPKLAISVYHKADDFWKIPEQILSIRGDYSLYLRHYTEGTDETIMFFVPK